MYCHNLWVGPFQFIDSFFELLDLIPIAIPKIEINVYGDYDVFMFMINYYYSKLPLPY